MGEGTTVSAKTEIKRYRRCLAWDYARGASLFITISTEPRRPLFGRVVDGEMRLSPLGEKVAESLAAMPRLNPGLRLFGRVVMPDHVHFNVALAPGLSEPLKVLGNAIRRFKNYTTKVERSSTINAAGQPAHSSTINAAGQPARCSTIDAEGKVELSSTVNAGGRAAPVARAASVDGRAMLGQKLWQQGYHDRLCLRREFIDATERYIRYNPLKWQLMHGADRALAIHDPLDSPRLDANDYWKGVGNVALLGEGEKIAAVRISRRCGAAQIDEALRRLDRAVDLGYVILSGFVSPGEKALRDRLCARPDARFIRILPSCIPNARFKPESRYVPAFAAGRYLEIARGNDEVEFSRGACLDYNAEIVEIAHAGEGLALYWRETGVERL